jgi:DNA invertase Pin-like site-specific DNA recombinase
MRKAYSYQRFSSPKQREGDSIRRQNEAVEQFCKANGLTLVKTFRDEGISAFRGKNFSNESALSAFLKLVENGTIEKGSVLVVENMDRLSRESILPCLEKFIAIINRGIAIGAISLNKILDKHSVSVDQSELMMVLVEFMRAGNESDAKRTRQLSNLKGKLDRVKKGEKIWMGCCKPTWIIGFKDGHFTLDEKKVALIKDIFQRYLNGEHPTRIAKILNKTKTPTLRGLGRNVWTNVSVTELLKNKNVIGTFRSGYNRKNKTYGTEIDDYFPPIISATMFRQAQHKLSLRINLGGHSKYGVVRNLFRGLLFCESCGAHLETYTTYYKSKKHGVSEYVNYRCNHSVKGKECHNHGTLNVADFEAKMFQVFMSVNPKTNDDGATNGKLTELENQLAKVQISIDRFMTLTKSDALADMKEITSNLAELQNEKTKVMKEIESEKNKAVIIAHVPKALQLIREQLKNTNAGTITLVKGDALKRELIQLKQHLAIDDNRQQLRNMMPDVFQKVTIRLGKRWFARCEMLDGSIRGIKNYKPDRERVFPFAFHGANGEN